MIDTLLSMLDTQPIDDAPTAPVDPRMRVMGGAAAGPTVRSPLIEREALKLKALEGPFAPNSLLHGRVHHCFAIGCQVHVQGALAFCAAHFQLVPKEARGILGYPAHPLYRLALESAIGGVAVAEGRMSSEEAEKFVRELLAGTGAAR